MNNLKAGDKVAIKATGIECIISYASTTLQNNFYLLSFGHLIQRDSHGEIKEFFIEDLDYTADQKTWMQHEADEHSRMMQEVNHY
jgi:predicted glycosyltransferase